MNRIITKRLILRPWKQDDLYDFYNYCKNPEVGPCAGWEPHKNIDESYRVLQTFIKSEEVWAIEYRENGAVIGSIGLHEDKKRANAKSKMLGYVLSKDYWGKGIMTEAVKSVIGYVFGSTDIEIISVYHYPFNIRSKNVIEKCGFRYEGTLRSASRLYNGMLYDDVCYSITKEEYKANNR